MTLPTLFLLAWVLVCGSATPSWQFVEGPFLRLKLWSPLPPTKAAGVPAVSAGRANPVPRRGICPDLSLKFKPQTMWPWRRRGLDALNWEPAEPVEEAREKEYTGPGYRR